MAVVEGWPLREVPLYISTSIPHYIQFVSNVNMHFIQDNVLGG